MTTPESADSVSRFDRILRLAFPGFLFLLVLNLLDGILRAPSWMWNEVRLARSFSLTSGYALYPGEHSTQPIIGTMHAPVGYLVYAGLAFLREPLIAIVAASMLSAALCLTPLYWIHRRAEPLDSVSRRWGFLACASLVVAGPGTFYSVVNIHVDAAATCTSVLAAGLLVTGRRPLPQGTLACSAVLAVLSVFSKQTMAPVPIALALFVLFSEGRRQFIRYVLLLIVPTAVLTTAFLLAFRPVADLVFNVWTMALRLKSVSHASARLLEGLRAERATLTVLPPLLAILLTTFLYDPGKTLRLRFQNNRWLVFLIVAMFQCPVAIRAWTTSAGDLNHLGAVNLFLILAVTTGLMLAPIPRLIQRALLSGAVVAGISLPIYLSRSIRLLASSPVETAFLYERRYPGRAYFPMDPLAVLLARGRLTHFDFALHDRERAGFPIAPQQLSAGLPARYQLIAYPPLYDPPQSRAIASLLASMHPVTEPGLEGWRVFARGPAALTQPSAK
ncbi:MAG TPA: hypothetical protein VMJ34_13060 [Bryobacteraceae bacterium]|nr:hypothetical protein [Bryobacteraceae bacterium]